MLLRRSINEKRLDLYHTVNALEFIAIDIIINRTIGRNVKESVIYFDEFALITKRSIPQIRKALNNLEKLKIINQKKQQTYSVLGLNEDYFGELLISEQEAKDAGVLEYLTE